MDKTKETETNKEMENESKTETRWLVVPGETIVKGEDYLPGDGVRREGEDIVASRFGLADTSDRLIKVIALSGTYIPRRGNVVIGQVVNIVHNGWLVDIGGASNAFLSLKEVPRFINQDEMREQFDFGDMMVAKVWGVGGRGVDLSVKMQGFGKFDEGMIIKVNPNKVPRVIGKEGSMVNMIKEATGCELTVGQNGIIWIQGNTIDDELKTKRVIEFICENSSKSGLTEKVKEFVNKELK